MSNMSNLESKVREIAAYLPGWEPELSSHPSVTCYIESQNRELGCPTFQLQYGDRHQEQLEVTGVYYENHPPNFSKAPKITVATHRSPEQIAEKIKHRFLPRFLEVHAECTQRKLAYERRKQQEQDTLSKLARALGSPAEQSPHRGGDGFYMVINESGILASVEVKPGYERMILELKLDYNLALTVCEAIGEYRHEHPNEE